jgi:DNA modification methylase
MGEITLLCGDCFEFLPSIPADSVQMVLADLPYGTTNCAWDSQLPLPELWAHYTRICSGPIVLFAQTPFDKVLGVSNLPMLRYEWIWEKTHPTGHLNAKKAPMKAHENVLVFYSSQPVYNPIKTHGHIRKTATKRRDATPIYGDQSLHALPYDSTERYPRSVIVFPSDKQRSSLHPTQKPVALCEYLIRTYTNPGDTVLDNVMGSGTTGAAALNCGRHFIGMELRADYFAIASDRLDRSQSTSPLLLGSSP